MKRTLQVIPIDRIAFDRENPRIKIALAKYGNQLDDARIRFALQTVTEGSTSTSSYRSLKDSIRAAGGIQVPIVILRNGDGFVCIDGNTRLAIYQELRSENVPGDWSTILSQVLDHPDRTDIETIRVTAHLVGAREWPAYEKAQYLHHLRNVDFMSYDELIARCGGNKASIDRQIDAYHDMNEYYRDVTSDDEFHVDRFSGFVELQKPGIKEAIFRAGFDLHDFGKWIRSGQIYRLADVRKLPKVLEDKEARDVFVAGALRSIEKATAVADANRQAGADPAPLDESVADAGFFVLAHALLQRIQALPYQEVVDLRNREHETAEHHVELLRELVERLQRLVTDVSE